MHTVTHTPEMPNPGNPIELRNACRDGDTAVVKAWLEAGGDPNATVHDGKPAWWHAIEQGEEGAVQHIVDCEGTDLELKSTATWTGTKDHTALSYVAYKGQLGLAWRLLRGGADARATGKDGRTALEWAEAWGHEAVAQLLREHLQQQPPEPPRTFATSNFKREYVKTGVVPIRRAHQVMTHLYTFLYTFVAL